MTYLSEVEPKTNWEGIYITNKHRWLLLTSHNENLAEMCPPKNGKIYYQPHDIYDGRCLTQPKPPRLKFEHCEEKQPIKWRNQVKLKRGPTVATCQEPWLGGALTM